MFVGQICLLIVGLLCCVARSGKRRIRGTALITEYLPMSNFPVRGVIIQMGQNEIPLIHLLNINRLLAKYGLPVSTIPFPEPGDGDIFVQKKYSLIVTSVALVILLIIIILIYIAERKQHQLGMDIIQFPENNRNDKDDPESILDL